MLSTLRDYQDQEISSMIRGTNVYGTEDEKLGSVCDAIVNPDSSELRYLIVDAGWLKARRFVIPADQVYAYRDGPFLWEGSNRGAAEFASGFRRKWANQICMLGRNAGGFLTFVSCSNPYAILISVGSLHARPKNEMPTGSPKTNPAGTLIFGYPATAAAFELPPVK
jgi:sporulation protein YlmC with PRC-barrel domain